MAEIVVSEFMDEAALEPLKAERSVVYDPALVDDRHRLLAEVADAAAIIVRNRTQVDAALLAAAPGLRCVGRLGVGLDNIDMTACEARGVAVFPATGANDLSVAEYVITAALVLLRGAWGASGEVAAGDWPRNRLMGREMAGKTLGLVGFGNIARRTAGLARALGMGVVAHDPLLPADHPGWAEAERLDLDRLVADADVISLHVPLTDGTRHMIGKAEIATMKPGAILVNAARGGVVDETALVAALKAGLIAGAALDVFEKEPVTAESGAIFEGIPNLILTPHIAGITEEGNVRVSSLTVENVMRHLEARN